MGNDNSPKRFISQANDIQAVVLAYFFAKNAKSGISFPR